MKQLLAILILGLATIALGDYEILTTGEDDPISPPKEPKTCEEGAPQEIETEHLGIKHEMPVEFTYTDINMKEARAKKCLQVHSYRTTIYRCNEGVKTTKMVYQGKHNEPHLVEGACSVQVQVLGQIQVQVFEWWKDSGIEFRANPVDETNSILIWPDNSDSDTELLKRLAHSKFTEEESADPEEPSSEKDR